jgi:GT2 family glycosyltransferase
VIDNGSTDGSVELVEQFLVDTQKPKIKIMRNGTNIGPSAARNEGCKRALGKYVAFLDNDTQVDPLWMTRAVKLMESDSTIGAIQCKLLLIQNRNELDHVGDYITQFGFLIQRARFREVDRGQFDELVEIFATKSAGMIVRLNIFQEVEGFDDTYFIYMEETDLCWRIWLAGYRVVSLPTSVVYHDFDIATTKLAPGSRFLVKYHGTKNYVMTLLKNLDNQSLLKMLPIHLSLWIGIAVWHASRKRFRESSWIVRGILWNAMNFRATWAKRRRVQNKIRKVSDKNLMPRIMRRTDLDYLYDKISIQG